MNDHSLAARLEAERNAWREEAALLAQALRQENPDHIALLAYEAFRAAAAKRDELGE